MCAAMISHIDEFGSARNGGKGGLFDSVGAPDEGYNSPIGVGPRIDVEQRDARRCCDLGSYGVDGRLVATLTEVGDTFDELHRYLLDEANTSERVQTG
jgi:hypothetical protein